MSGRRLLTTVGVVLVAGSGVVASALAQVRIEIPTVDVPDRRPNPQTGADMVDLAGGLFALRDGYDRSRRGHICILTYEDRNANGRRDRGEGPLPGWRFSIDSATGAPVAQGSTDSQGRFCNDAALAPGAYSVRQQPGGGWTNTEPGSASPDVKTVTLPAESSVTVLFGNCRGDRCEAPRPNPDLPRGPAGPHDPVGPGPGGPPHLLGAKVCVTKYIDLNGNGVQDGADYGLGGWTFTVRSAGGAVLASGMTNNQGLFCTPQSLPPGAVSVTETLLGGWMSTDPGGPTPAKTKVLASGDIWTVAFGNRHMPSTQICIEKYNDLNGDGVRQPNEPGLPGWAFTVTGPNGPHAPLWSPTAISYCDSAPYSAGVHTVTETSQPGWVATTPGGATQTFTLVPGQNRTFQFGNHQVPAASARVCVTKYNDLNGNGSRDAGEPALSGWTFTVKNTLAQVIASGTTDAQGKWCSSATLLPGPVAVGETNQVGWVSTDTTGAAPTKIGTLASGQTWNVSFGNRLAPPTPGGVCVVKFNDLNGDGQKQANEPFLGNWQFTVTGPSGSLSGSTDAQKGQWCTPQTLAPGAYTVTETMKSGWISTMPGGTAPQQTVAVVSGQAALVRFGNRLAPPPTGIVCIVKYDDINQNAVFDAGEAVLSGWQFNLKDGTGATVGQETTGANGRVCREMPSGAYAAYEVNQPGWSNSDPVGPALHKPFTIVGGQTVNLVFGNYQPPRLRFRKVVTSTAPGGGFPLTGLVFGNAFQINHNCVLGNQTGGSGTPVPANGVAPIAGYTGSSVGAVCTITETPPPGLIAWADCPTGQGHWDTPAIAATPHTIAPGLNEVTVTNRFVCEKGPPPAPVRLIVQKIKLTAGMCHGATAVQNQCLFQITVTNVGGSAYTGPINLVDTVTGAQPTVLTSPGLTCPSGIQTGSFACTGPVVTIAPGASVTYQMLLHLSSAAPAQKNCVVLTFGSPPQFVTACAAIFP